MISHENQKHIDKELNIDILEVDPIMMLRYLMSLKFIAIGQEAIVLLDSAKEIVVRIPILNNPLGTTNIITLLNHFKIKNTRHESVVSMLEFFLEELYIREAEEKTQADLDKSVGYSETDSALRMRIKSHNEHFAHDNQHHLPINTAFSVNGLISAFTMRYVNGETYLQRNAFLNPDLWNKISQIVGDTADANTIIGSSVNNMQGHVIIDKATGKNIGYIILDISNLP